MEKFTRPEKDEYFLQIAELASTRATCSRRRVGCVFVSDRGHILSTGYNGNAPGAGHCIDNPCPGAQCPSGEGLDLCEAAHAEINALSQCPDIFKVNTIYVTTAPCSHCTKALLNTSAKRIVYRDDYSDAHSSSRIWWERAGREWIKYAA